MADDWLIYGANGYTGTLVARLAVARGERPILAGRNGAEVAALAGELGLDHRVADLRDLGGLLDGVRVVAHCAGPFAVTSAPMVDACLAAGVHYLDVTGETGVFEAVFARHDDAVAAGVVLLPGIGFDVVPTDCLSAMVAAAVPGAVGLEIAFLARGGMSRGTALTSVAGMADGGRVRRDGRLVPAPAGSPARTVPFPSGERRVGAIRWGDLVTAARSTGIPNITTYTSLPGGGRGAGLSKLVGVWPVRAIAERVVRSRPAGPSPQTRAKTNCEVWCEARDAAGHAAVVTLTGPNAYDLTADSVVRAAGRVAAATPGAHTPSSAFGPDYVRELDGVTVSGVTVAP